MRLLIRDAALVVSGLTDQVSPTSVVVARLRGFHDSYTLSSNYLHHPASHQGWYGAHW